MDYFKKATGPDIDVGGWKCYCCGPSPKDRPKFRRRARRRVKAEDRKLLQEALVEQKESNE